MLGMYCLSSDLSPSPLDQTSTSRPAVAAQLIRTIGSEELTKVDSNMCFLKDSPAARLCMETRYTKSIPIAINMVTARVTQRDQKRYTCCLCLAPVEIRKINQARISTPSPSQNWVFSPW